MEPRVFAVIHKNSSVRMASRSGGVFTALSDVVLSEKGIVYGCCMEGNRHAVHKSASTPEERNLFRTSKYIESDLSLYNCYRSVKRDLLAGNAVLFSGTSCQIDGLISALSGIDRSKLVTVDILCHGIPSSRIWRDYLEWFSEKKKGEVEKIVFRDKEKFGWADHTETITINRREYHNKYYRDLYSTNNISRPACYNCPYKNTHHGADITIGDYWGLGKVLPDFGTDNKGVSLVIINTERGLKIFDTITEMIDSRETDIMHCLQGALQSPYRCPAGRNDFWKYYYSTDFEDVIKKYTNNPLLSKIKQMVPSQVRKKLRGK